MGEFSFKKLLDGRAGRNSTAGPNMAIHALGTHRLHDQGRLGPDLELNGGTAGD